MVHFRYMNKNKYLLSTYLFFCLVACLPNDVAAKVQLARDGKPLAVIVAEDWAPDSRAGIAHLSVTTPQSNDLLRETFEGQLGTSIETLGWTTSEGTYVVSYNGKELGNSVRAHAPGKSPFTAIAEKNLSKPHTVTDDAPLTLEFVLTLPANTSQESWAYVRLHTAAGKRWVHGLGVSSEGEKFFAMAAEPSDPDRVLLPNSAGNVLDLKMELHSKTVRWYWRNHGSKSPYQEIQQWAVSAEVTITGVRISSKNHEGYGNRERSRARLDTATSDLKKYLDEVTGGNFEIVGPEAAPKKRNRTRIFVGDSPAVRELLPKVDWNSLATDEILIKTVGKDLVISGGSPRGKVYAIYTFLQDIVGCRWWAPGEISIPSKPNLSVRRINLTYEPPFKMRVHSGKHASSHEARTWLRYSYDLNFDYGTHSIPHLLPRELFVEHPDYFCYQKDDGDPNAKYGYLAALKGYQKTIDTETERNDLDLMQKFIDIGRRTRRLPQQPCLHSEGARRTITENALKQLEQKYPNWKYPEKIFWLTQNDGAYMCQCDKCEEVRQAEGSESANWVLMVNEIAEKIEAKYPDVLVGMFAYQNTEAPPKTLRPRHNVLVYSALLRSNKRDPVWNYPKYRRHLEKWGQIANHYYVWEYDANFRNFYQPHPNYLVHPESMEFFHKIGVTGLLVQGAKGVAADLGSMRAWVNAQMMWNLDHDPRQLMKEFANGYYGEAGPYILQYIDLLLTAVHRDPDYWLGCYRNDTTGWLTLDDINESVAILQQAAEAVQEDETLSRRVWLASRGIHFAWMDRYEELQKESNARGIALEVPDPNQVLDELTPYRWDWGMFREGPRPSGFNAYYDELREQFSARSGE